MKKIYLLFMVAMLSTVAFAQSTFTIVADSHEGDADTGPSSIVANSSMLVYSGDGVHSWDKTTTIAGTVYTYTYFDSQVWVSDGTAANTRLMEINSTTTYDSTLVNGVYYPYTQYNSASYLNPIVFNDKIYFSANNGTSTNIYTIDGLSGDTVRVIDGTWGTPQFIANGNLIYKSNSALYAWDGTNTPAIIPNQTNAAGDTVLVVPSAHGTYLNGKYLFYGKLTTDPNSYNTELFSLDPSGTDGPQLVKDIYDGSYSSVKYFVNSGDSVAYFVARATDKVYSLWVTDGTTDGTHLVSEVADAIAATSSVSSAFGANGLIIYKDKLYFEADNVTNYDQLWSYDLNTKAVTRLTTLVKADGSGTAVNFDPNNYVICNDTLYFTGAYTYIKDGATSSSTTTALYKINSAGVPEMIGDSYLYTNLNSLTVFNDKIYLQAEDSVSGKELFVYDPAASASGIQNASAATAVSLYPNPSDGFVSVNGLDGTEASYKIYDLTGKCVDAGATSNGAITYDLNSGIYMIQIQGDGKSLYSKMIVK